MHEKVLALIVGRDEPEALLVAEPLDSSGCHGCSLPGGYVRRNAGGAVATTTNAGTELPGRSPGTMHDSLARGPAGTDSGLSSCPVARVMPRRRRWTDVAPHCGRRALG